MQKPVIVKVIIHVVDQNREGDSPPKLLYVDLRIRPVSAQRIHDFGIRVVDGITGFCAE
jgi:hypothetical protein